jgi:transposase
LDTINIGVDLHKHQFTNYYLFKKDGVYRKYSTNEVGMTQFKSEIKMMLDKGFKVRVAVESTGNTRFFKNEIEKLGVEVIVVNTLKFKIVNESVNKTDKRDAKVISEFLEKDMLPKVNLSSEKSEKIRRLVSIRKELVRTRVKMKNTIHGMLLGFGIATKAGLLNSKKGLKKAVEMATDDENRLIVETIVDTIEKLSVQIKDIESKIEKMVEGDRSVEILQSFPGTGLLNAVTVRAYIDDIKRFSHFNKLSGYCGLVPWVSCSDESQHYGRITKRGPVELRTAIIQMVLGMIRCKDEKNNRVMKVYQYMKKNKGSGKALVATARKFTKIIWFMLTNDEFYKTEKINAVFESESHRIQEHAA